MSTAREQRGSSTWRRVTCGKVSGWVNERFLAVEGTGQSPSPSQPSQGETEPEKE